MTASGTLTVGDRWLECHVEKGMFSDELAISYPPIGESRISAFVPRDLVERREGSQGRVRVSIVRRGGDLFAILPTAYRDSVFVSESDIAE
ncbi:MAG: hypothetical protein KC931_13580 [Candidatus Omnitrophica bacterium]|nr:hypothetical protein [Candidatus Omnitrophota bacterium]MCA9414986.1 hypothetical protein [Candidatus Omnitrophota bacterium]MCA9426032.1 hypothetical protein [Candidatus Omnitrophota bacterium]MCA9431436.1 hypothetical protein [Candidatus Omnitrophota bacterium]MCA9438626.1 hypothetical protein [Candidatus Omnitrophota bacterium]